MNLVHVGNNLAKNDLHCTASTSMARWHCSNHHLGSHHLVSRLAFNLLLADLPHPKAFNSRVHAIHRMGEFD
jgi:hypothetical protein